MEENESRNQEINETPLPEVKLDDLKETIDSVAEEILPDDIELSESEIDELKRELEKPKEVNFRHPQQMLTNNEIQILFEKKGVIDQQKEEIEKQGGDPNTVEDLTETEKGAISLFLVRAKFHNSKAKQLSSKLRKARKKARKISKKSRKVNR